MNNFDKTLKILTEELLYEESNYRPKHTGLAVIVYISVGEVEGKQLYHSPRIKANNNYSLTYTKGDTISLTIEDDPTVIGDVHIKQNDLVDIKRWIVLNKTILLRFWKFEIDDVEFVQQMKRI